MNFLHYGSAEVTVCRTIHAVNEVQKCCATIGFALEAARAWRRVEFELLSCKVSFAAANIGFKYIQILNKRTPLFVSCKSLARVLVRYVYDYWKLCLYVITPGDSVLDVPLSMLARLLVDRVLKKH